MKKENFFEFIKKLSIALLEKGVIIRDLSNTDSDVEKELTEYFSD